MYDCRQDKVGYRAPAWTGSCSATDRARLETF